MDRRVLRSSIVWIVLSCNTWCSAAAAAAVAAQPATQRIVFLGDSITDGHTYPQLVRQALAEAGRRPPVCINAGIGGDTAAGMRKRLDRDVLVHRPTLVTLSAGINDVLHKVPAADYRRDVEAVCRRMADEKVPVLILTTSILGPRHAEADRRLAEYNAALGGLAAKHGCRLAEVDRLMQDARKAGTELMEADHVHPNWAGQRLMARAVLDALGHKEVPLPERLKLELMPGVIRAWRIRPVAKKEPPLDEKAVAALKPDASWKAYTLPEKGPAGHWWRDDERKRGFALSLKQQIGAGRSYVGLAVLEEARPRKVYFNTGAQLEALWLNGRRIYKRDGWTGWHAGRDRIAAELAAGRNAVVIECGGEFFLSVTGDNTW